MKHFYTFVILLVTIFCFGCQGSSLPGLAPVSGVVTLDGNPIDGATVVFIPRDFSTQRNAFALTNTSGSFRMTTVKENDGVLPGTYIVTVTKHEKSGQVIKLDEYDVETGEQLTFEPSVNRLPAVYENEASTPLEITVSKGGTKTATFELTSQ